MFEFFYNFLILVAIFFIYSFIGWVFEVISFLIMRHKLVNRGFLFGPIIPIWGACVLLMTLFLKPDDSVFSLFISSAVIATVLEYIINFIMEKLFKARWWDYSHLPFNINGRVWLGSATFFGLGGLLALKFFNPLFYNLLIHIDKTIFTIMVCFLLIIFIVDIIVSCNIIQKLKFSAEAIRTDYTEEITKKVKNTLMNKSLGFKRLLKAFPNVTFSFKIKK